MLVQLFAAVLASPMVLAQDASKFLPFNLTVPPTSGMVTQTGTWTTYVNGTRPYRYLTGMPGDVSIVGLSGATTADPNLSGLTLQFSGTAIYIDGKVTNARDVFLMTDGENSPIEDWTNDIKILGSSAVMGAQKISVNSYGTLNVSTKSTTALSWIVDSVTFATGLLTDALTFEDVPKTTEYFTSDNILNSNFTWVDNNGSWAAVSTLKDNYTFPSAEAKALQVIPFSSPTVTIPVPRNTSFFIINGTTGPDYSGLRLNINGAPAWIPARPEANCSNTITLPNQPLFFSPLDPANEYTLTLSLTPSPDLNPNVTAAANLHSVTFYTGLWWVQNVNDTADNRDGPKRVTDDGTDSATTGGGSDKPTDSPGSNGSETSNGDKKKVSTGVIAGAIVAAVVVFILIIILTWVIATKRVQRYRKRILQDKETFEVDDSVVVPFLAPASQAASTNNLLSPPAHAATSSQTIPLGSSPAAAPIASTKIGLIDEQGASSSSSGIASVPVHATDSAQLPPIYDPRWREGSEGTGLPTATTTSNYQDHKQGLISSAISPSK